MRLLNSYLLLLSIALFFGCKEEDPLPETPEEDTPVSETPITPNSFLSGSEFDKLVVEVQYVEGYQPKAESLAKLKTFLEQRLNKPAGIELTQNQVASPGKEAYSLNDIREIEEANRKEHHQGQTLTAYFFFADGDYASNSGDSKVLGIAYGSSSMVIFEKTIREFSGGISQPSTSMLETTVIKHEFGHTLGLVNNGTPMQADHQDEAHGRHCTDKNCLMYYTAETSDVVANLVGGSIPELDAACLKDLRGNGGK